MPTLSALPGAPGEVPIVGFEIESSWRTRKHLKGDYLNLHDLGAALGALVLLGDGADVEATRRFAETLVDRPGPRVLVWSEQDVETLVRGGQIADRTPTLSVTEPRPEPPAGRHVGKFQALWDWLRDQASDRVAVTFSEIEEVIGMPLPPSCRKHPAHWSSYDGSTIARAIQDAGWVATRVNLRDQTAVFERRTAARAARR
ncbi:DUF7662 domain-containing protein [Planosporangium mesophilum]